MTRYRAALPMYDLPELRGETHAVWDSIVSGLKSRGADPLVDFHHPQTDDETDALLRHPQLLFSQTCWGPISCGVAPDLHILAQPDFSEFTGGMGPLYRSAIIATGRGPDLTPPKSGKASLPIPALEGKRLAFNDRVSLSGYLSITADMAAATGSRSQFYGKAVHSGSHRRSVDLVAKGSADIAAIDCRTWALCRRFDAAAKQVRVIGWTQARKGLPYVCSPKIDAALKSLLTETLLDLGAHPAT